MKNQNKIYTGNDSTPAKVSGSTHTYISDDTDFNDTLNQAMAFRPTSQQLDALAMSIERGKRLIKPASAYEHFTPTPTNARFSTHPPLSTLAWQLCSGAFLFAALAAICIFAAQAVNLLFNLHLSW